MSKDQIVIVTQMEDPHADNVIVALQEMGYDSTRLNTDDIPSDIEMSLHFNNNETTWSGSIEILTNGRIVNVDTVRSVWWRRPAEFALPEDLSEQEREFARGEIDHALRGLWSSLDCYWVSYPEHIRQADWKLGQLRRAAHLGFEVPRTLVTNDPTEARSFYYACAGRIIYKVFTDTFLGAPKIAQKYPEQQLDPYQTLTTFITESELAQLDSVRLVPCMFQEYIPKQLELRVTVIGDEVFAAEIHSQADQRTSLDYRNFDVDIPYREATLPVEVAERCLSFVRSYELNFSALDLILTPDGRYVFVENNPNGQFIFIEQLVPELRMTEALAACLVRGANS